MLILLESIEWAEGGIYTFYMFISNMRPCLFWLSCLHPNLNIIFLYLNINIIYPANYIATLLIQKFVRTFPCFFAAPKPNTATCFYIVDVSQLSLANSPSLLRPFTWVELLSGYPVSLWVHLLIIIHFEAELDYKSPTNTLIFSKNLSSTLVNTKIIDKKLGDNLEF